MLFNIPTVKDAGLSEKRVIVRVDFDVSLNSDHTIANDTRIKSNIPTLKLLLEQKNKLILVAKLGRPEGRDMKFSLKPVVDRLPEYLPGYSFKLVDDFLTETQPFENQQDNEILVLENIRFYPEEKENDPAFVEKLALLGDVYVNDVFSMAHRSEASVVGLPTKLPSYAGLSLEEEVDMVGKALNNPQKPVVTILGGAKISTKMGVIKKLIPISDHILLGGGLADTFLKAKGYSIGKSICEDDFIEMAKEHIGAVELPTDVVTDTGTKLASDVSDEEYIYDIGPETQKKYTEIIASAQTILWNGPMGFFEKSPFDEGTRAVCAAITANSNALSLVGGGDTLTAIADLEHVGNITHISTGGGAMLEFIENGTLPGLEALRKQN